MWAPPVQPSAAVGWRSVLGSGIGGGVGRRLGGGARLQLFYLVWRWSGASETATVATEAPHLLMRSSFSSLHLRPQWRPAGPRALEQLVSDQPAGSG